MSEKGGGRANGVNCSSRDGRPKGKAIEVPTSKRHKKRKKSKTHVEETPKEVKLLASAISAARKTKVHPRFYLLM